MTAEELVEKVAREMCEKAGLNPNIALSDDEQDLLWTEFADHARAAIAIVIEEAAQIVEANAASCSGLTATILRSNAAAIRALSPEK